MIRVVDLAPDLEQGADDEAVFAYASRQGLVVLSSDERALWRPKSYHAQGLPFAGMFCWPRRHRDRMTIGDALAALERLSREDDPFAFGFRFIQPLS